MILRLDIERLRTLEEVRDFLAGSEPVDFHFTDRRGAYDFVTRALRRLNYGGLSKAHKGVVRRFVAKVTGWSRAHTTRLIGQYRKTGRIEDRRRGATRPFQRRYTAADIRLLAEVDEKLGGVCGPSTRRVMQRQYELFGDRRFERLGGAVEQPSVPSAPQYDVPASAQSHDEDQAHPGQHWRAPQAAPAGASGFSAGGFGAPRRPRWPQGVVRSQPRG